MAVIIECSGGEGGGFVHSIRRSSRGQLAVGEGENDSVPLTPFNMYFIVFHFTWHGLYQYVTGLAIWNMLEILLLLYLQRLREFRTDALFREDPFGAHEYNIPYSMSKSKRWMVPDMFEDEIENVQVRKSFYFNGVNNACSYDLSWNYGQHDKSPSPVTDFSFPWAIRAQNLALPSNLETLTSGQSFKIWESQLNHSGPVPLPSSLRLRPYNEHQRAVAHSTKTSVGMEKRSEPSGGTTDVRFFKFQKWISKGHQLFFSHSSSRYLTDAW